MTVSTLVWHVVGSDLTRRGRPDPRQGLVYGQYLPVAAGTSFGTTGVNCGLLDSSLLTNHNASSVNTLTLTDGQTITNKTVHGYLRAPSTHNSDIVIENCLLRGGPTAPSGAEAVVKADIARGGTGRVIIRDSEVWPQNPALWLDGVRGNRILLERVWIHDVIDGFVPFASTSMNSGNANSYAYGCRIERLRYMYPDAEHGDGTHNDAIAVSGGKNIGIKGNFVRATSVDLPGTGTNPTHPNLQSSNAGDGTNYAHGACIIITNTVSNPLDNTVIIEENWFMGGISQINVKPNMTCIFRNNRHYRAAYVGTGPTHSGYWVRYDARPGNGVTADNSTWVDGPYAGQVLTEPRDRGVHFNP